MGAIAREAGSYFFVNGIMIAVQTEKLAVALGNNPVLIDIDCQIHEGEYVAILGPNGAGKTVFIKVLLGLIRPTAGEVLVFGQTPDKVVPAWLGYVPQVKTLDRSFPALAVELVVTGLTQRWQPWPSRAEKQAASQALAQVGAGHLAERPVANLSGGELQRVYIARALVRRPRLVLLDEPVTGVDTVGETDFYRVLESFRQESGATIIMVTHDWEIAARTACHVLVLNRRVIGFGTPAEVLCNDCLKRAYGVASAVHLSSCPRNGHG